MKLIDELSAWSWIPRERFGPFVFGEKLEEYEKDLKGSLLFPIGDGQSDVYGFSGLDYFSVTFCDGLVETVSQEKWCCYGGLNIIGMPVCEIYSRFGKPYEIETDFFIGVVQYTIIRFDFPFDAEFWLSNDKVVSIGASRFDD